METCTRCNEHWFDMRLKDGVCHTCFLRDKRGAVPFLMSAANNMDPGEVPAHLPKLSQVEEMTIARSHVQMVLCRVRGHQYKYSGHCVSFMQNTVRVVDTLPNIPAELDVVLLRPSDRVVGNEPQLRRQFRSDFRLRKSRVKAWLDFLVCNHPDYRDIVFSPARLQSLPEDGDISPLLPVVVDQDATESEEAALAAGNIPDPVDSDLPPPDALSMIPNLGLTETEVDLLMKELAGETPAEPQIQPVPDPAIPAPTIRSTPLDEAAASMRIFAMAFPTLYPTGCADFRSPRLRKVKLKEYARHLLYYKDSRFAIHPRWRFFVFNIIMRQSAGSAARFYVSRHSDLSGLSRNELVERLESDPAVTDQIARQGHVISGTRPFWTRKGSTLQALARFLSPSMSPVFLTFSAADMQWYDLHRHIPGGENLHLEADYVRKKWIWDAVQSCPHIVAAYLDIRFSKFAQHVLKPTFKYGDFWTRYEWQARGSGHIHGLFWIPDAPPLDQSSPAARERFATFWSAYTTAWHTNPDRLPDLRNPASLPPRHVQNSFDQLAAFQNRFQLHSECKASYCLRKKKGTDIPACRFHFPRPLFSEPVVTKEINHQTWTFSPARNHPRLNQCSPVVTMGWMANTDVSPPTTLGVVLAYVAKYVSKPEIRSVSFKELQTQILPHVKDRSSILSYASKLLNRLVAERDYSAQEVAHGLLSLPFSDSSRQYVWLDCRPDTDNPRAVAIEEETGELAELSGPLARYRARPMDSVQVANLTLFEALRSWDWRSWRLRPRAAPRIICYVPRYKSDPNGSTYEDWCRVKLMLHHPFSDDSDLLSVDDERYTTFAEAYQACSASHRHHPEDFYTDPPEEPEDPDQEEFEDPSQVDPQDPQLNDFEQLAQRLPNRDAETTDRLDSLGSRPQDRAYDWSAHVGRYDPLDRIIWDQVKAENPIELSVTMDPDPLPLNREQRLLFDTLVDQYIAETTPGAPRPPQLLLNLDGAAGVGKTFAILKACACLQQLAREAGRSDPVLRAAPTGVAAFGLLGRTLHTLLRLPIRGKSDLSTSSLQSLQSLFAYCSFLIVDEKSMIPLSMLSLIDNRLRAIKPRDGNLPFGGMNVVLGGDFYQLPPVGGQALFSTVASHPDAISGRELYRAFDRTIRLTTIMRQQGDDENTVRFRAALNELRASQLSQSSWELLCTRVVNQVSPSVAAEFDDALRIFYTRAQVNETNFEQVARTGKPVKRLEAHNSSRSAEKATEEEAENLVQVVQLCIGARVMLTTNLWTEIGLVNGCMGTVVDIVWNAGIDVTSLPTAVLLKFDGYTGPDFPIVRPGVVPVFSVSRTFELKGVSCTRTQLPLRLGYAITVHKSQGLTLQRAVLDLNQKEYALGLSYVAASRVKTLNGLLFLSPFDFDQFKGVDTPVSRDRELDYAFRTRQMLS